MNSKILIIAFLILLLIFLNTKTVNRSESYLNDKHFPPAIRNNNPFNLRHTSIGWLGKIDPDTVLNFERFADFAHGLRAGAIDHIGNFHEGKTLAEVIYKKSPPSDNNDTESYIRFIQNATGLSRTSTFKDLTPSVLRAYIRAIFNQEAGIKYDYILTPAAIDYAINQLPFTLPK